MGIGGPMIVPSGRLPSRIEAMICASVQLPMPVSLSGVMFGALAPNPGVFLERRHAREFHAGDIPGWALGCVAVAAGNDRRHQIGDTFERCLGCGCAVQSKRRDNSKSWREKFRNHDDPPRPDPEWTQAAA